MKTRVPLIALLASALALPALAAAPVCIRSYFIDHTERPSDNAILFYMRDGSVYRNDLPQRCPGLRVAVNGFTYEPTDPGTDELCDNLASFRVNEGFGPGAGPGVHCLFGAFTKLK